MCCRVNNFINLSTLIPSLCWAPLLNIAYVYCLIIFLNSQKVVLISPKYILQIFEIAVQSSWEIPQKSHSLSNNLVKCEQTHIHTLTCRYSHCWWNWIVLWKENAERHERRQSTKNKFEQNKPQKRGRCSQFPQRKDLHICWCTLEDDNTWRQKRTKQNNKCAKKERKRREERWVKNKAYITTTPVKYYHKFCWQNAKNVDDDDDVVVVIIILIVVVADVMAGASAGVVCVRIWLCFSCCCFCLKKVNEPFRYDFTGEWLWKFFL